MAINNFRIRFVERPLSERPLTQQADAIIDDNSLRVLTISDIGIEMLTSLVGRGMPPSLRQVIANSLMETMQGQVSLGDEAMGNILTEVYGEVIGPLITCLERGGDFEIIRLERQKGADMLLVNRQSAQVILQECKGTFADYVKVKDNTSNLDVCQQIRDQRNSGIKQLKWPTADEIGSKRVRISGGGSKELTFLPFSEETVVVTAIPDGRLRKSGLKIEPPSHEPCEMGCAKHCLFSPEPTLVCVLCSEEIDGSIHLDESTLNFLDWYKACERAIWGNAHGSVGKSYASLLTSLREMELSAKSQEGTFSILTGLLEKSLDRNVFVDFRPIFEVSETIKQPDLSRVIRYLHDLQGEIQKPRVNDVEVEELAEMLYGTEEEKYRERLIGNWRFRTSGPRSGKEGTLAEAAIQRTTSGNIEMRVVPAQKAMAYSSDDLRWAISNLLAGERFPSEFVYELFFEEEVSWETSNHKRKPGGGVNNFSLGHVLAAPPFWPFWFPFYNRENLRDMHHCCPDCDMIAHWIEGHLPIPPDFFFRRYWHHHHRKHRWTSFMGHGPEPLAFVTADARGIMYLPFL